ncbi:MAG: hypothetical protein ACI8Q1_001771, partial [Parvicella sp.]
LYSSSSSVFDAIKSLISSAISLNLSAIRDIP